MKTLAGALSCLAALVLTLTTSGAEEQALWRAGVDGYHTYRIPALLVAPSGTVLAFCEGRKMKTSDAGDIDLLLKRSTDGGRTWSAQQLVYEEGGEAPITIGNPCLVADGKTGTLWLAFTRNNKSVHLTSSKDDGATWSPPRDVSSTAMRDGWKWVATGPGVGIQLARGEHAGRLVIPCDHKTAEEWNSHMMYSDDGGGTWAIGEPIKPGGNECQVIEREDGSLLVNARIQDANYRAQRGVATSADGGQTWTTLTDDEQLPCPKCQASLVRQNWGANGKPGCVLFSNPAEPGEQVGEKSRNKRARLTLRASLDDGKTWPIGKILREGPSAYSCLATLADGKVLCLYEGGAKSAYEALWLVRVNGEELMP